MKVTFTNEAPQAIGPYSQAIVVNNLIFTSGQIPLTKEGILVGETIEEQTHQVLKNIQAILEASGSNLNQVIKATIFLNDLADFSKVNEIYGSYFTDHKPARSCVEVSRLPRDVRIEIEVIASCEVNVQ